MSTREIGGRVRGLRNERRGKETKDANAVRLIRKIDATAID